MKTKEQILNDYYSHGADGQPEITADGLLKAMEEYRLQTEEAAFNAGREMHDTAFKYQSFTDYRAGLNTKPNEPTEAERIKLVAESIVEQFLPDDPTTQHFAFEFKTDGKQYTAHYIRNAQGYWEYESFV
ncbi:hypothetical protein ACFQZX_01085 [Mucilaginibacter litoreus]|uniref:Uncharacterized protein n=1 Tax=Mucilaginibacter litoreus TaxID=1048221 RepID=A0ABW3AMI1_9SPHI